MIHNIEKNQGLIALTALIFTVLTYLFTKELVVVCILALITVLYTGYILKTQKITPNFDSVRQAVKILFIDDKECQIVKTMKRNGFDVRKVNDVTSPATDQDVIWSNIIFVDYKGIGKKLFGKKEGLGLISELKRIYGDKKKYIIYSSVQDFDGLTDFPYIRKNASYDEFISYIEAEYKKL